MANINISDLRPADSASYLNDLTEEEILYVEGGFFGTIVSWYEQDFLPSLASFVQEDLVPLTLAWIKGLLP